MFPRQQLLHVAAKEEFEAETDSDAVIVARALYAERAARDGLELWEDTRRVLSEDEVLALV